jgi:hypothetical protein
MLENNLPASVSKILQSPPDPYYPHTGRAPRGRTVADFDFLAAPGRSNERGSPSQERARGDVEAEYRTRLH